MSDEPAGRAAEILASWLPESMLEAFDAAETMVTITEGADHRLVWRNRAAIEMYGERELGRPLVELFPEASEMLPLWDEAFGGASVVQPRKLVRPPDVTGRRRVMRYSMSPLRSHAGAITGVIQFVSDATPEVDAESDAARSQLLATVAAAMASAVDASTALRALSDALVQDFADLSAVFVYDARANRQLRSSGAAIAPVALSLHDGLRSAGPPPMPADREQPSVWRSALARGGSVIVPISDELLAGLEPDPVASWLTGVGATSIAVVPMMIGGEIAGSLLAMSAGSRPPYDEADLELLDELALRAGAAISEVRAREHTERVAQRLQSALLPRDPPQPAGLEIAARYVPGGPDNPVGGDWWEAIDLGEGFIGLGVGDISGHGIGAAALMGQARVAMRTACLGRRPPAELLELLDRHLSQTLDHEWDPGEADLHRFATALYALADLGAQVLRTASAGHLPLLRRPCGGATEVRWVSTGPPLGLGLGRYDEVPVPFQPGDVAVLYTDGLVEDRGVEVTEGIRRLAALIDGVDAQLPLDSLADRILDEMDRAPTPEDDIALILARRLPA